MADREAETTAISGQPQKITMDFDPPKKPKINKYAFTCALLATMTSALLGYDIGVMSGAMIYIKDDLKISDIKIEILAGIINLYSLIGSWAAGRTSDWIGRRYTILVAQAIFFAGAILMGFATNYAFLMVGRFVAGIGVGYALMIAPVYTAEISPASTRGFLTSFFEIEILAGIINLYSLIGSWAAGRTSDWIGRRYTILVAQAIFFAGAILMGFATNYAFLMVGRFVAGIGVGYALMIAPVYTAEISPASTRGFLTSFFEVFINFGILLGYVSNYVCSKLPTYWGWRVMLGVGAVAAMILAFVVLWMPESPRWLVMQGRLGDAKRVLDKTSDSVEEAQVRLADIKDAAGIPENLTDDVVQVPKHSHGEGVGKS
ncbi:polyol transporter 5 [Quercus suber]|uniref:Polyol transporter 5 n=1 Tax=Quercus suber TaxID=58331 RepID=A0AAW0LEY5_QUESU